MRALIRVTKVDPWATAGGKTLHIIKADTIEAHPQWLTLRTLDALKGSLCQESMRTKQLLWAEYRTAWHAKGWQEFDLVKIEVDDSQFQHDQAAS